MRQKGRDVNMFKVVVKKEEKVIFSHFFRSKEEANKFTEGLKELGMIPLLYTSAKVVEVEAEAVFHLAPNKKLINVYEDENGIFALIQK